MYSWQNPWSLWCIFVCTISYILFFLRLKLKRFTIYKHGHNFSSRLACYSWLNPSKENCKATLTKNIVPMFWCKTGLYGSKLSGWEICTFRVTFCQFSWWPRVKMSHRRAGKKSPVDKYTKDSNGMALFLMKIG